MFYLFPICTWTLGEYIATGITIKQNDYFFKKIFSLTCFIYTVYTELEENALQQVSVSDEEITHTDTYLFVCAHGLDENALQQVLCVGVLVCWCVGVLKGCVGCVSTEWTMMRCS